MKWIDKCWNILNYLGVNFHLVMIRKDIIIGSFDCLEYWLFFIKFMVAEFFYSWIEISHPNNCIPSLLYWISVSHFLWKPVASSFSILLVMFKSFFLKKYDFLHNFHPLLHSSFSIFFMSFEMTVNEQKTFGSEIERYTKSSFIWDPHVFERYTKSKRKPSSLYIPNKREVFFFDQNYNINRSNACVLQ